MVGETAEIQWYVGIDNVHQNDSQTNNLLLHCHHRAFQHLIQGPENLGRHLSPVPEPTLEEELVQSLNYSFLARSPTPTSIFTPKEHARFEEQLREWDGPVNSHVDLSRISRDWDLAYPDMAWHSYRASRK